MDKSVFNEIKKLMREYEDINNRLNIEENKVVVDSVKGSSSQYPYVEHNCVVEGIQDSKKYRRYKKMLNNKKREIGKKLLNFEYQMNYIEDSEIRTILRYKYVDGLKNYQIANEMNNGKIKYDKEYTADSIRMQLNRFFEKN